MWSDSPSYISASQICSQSKPPLLLSYHHCSRLLSSTATLSWSISSISHSLFFLKFFSGFPLHSGSSPLSVTLSPGPCIHSQPHLEGCPHWLHDSYMLSLLVPPTNQSSSRLGTFAPAAPSYAGRSLHSPSPTCLANFSFLLRNRFNLILNMSVWIVHPDLPRPE